ncbi:hypothetical protein [Staphylococcus phage vB_ScaM-V1SC04]|nr:hypothetical protein [Staphylococcus phage vB_ScaM-V1SC04]
MKNPLVYQPLQTAKIIPRNYIPRDLYNFFYRIFTYI